jgi:hypothetical protein
MKLFHVLRGGVGFVSPLHLGAQWRSTVNKARRRRRRRELKPLSVRPRESAAERVETPRPLPRWRIRTIMAGLALAGATLGAGIVLHVRGWPALGSESGGRCGGRFGAACPQGLDWVLLLAFGSTFAAFIALVGLSHAFMTRVDALRPGRAGLALRPVEPPGDRDHRRRRAAGRPLAGRSALRRTARAPAGRAVVRSTGRPA